MSVYSKLSKNPIIALLLSHIDVYPTPINLTYLWGFGSLAGLALVAQIVTGLLLAMHYAAEVHIAFTSVEHIMRDVKGGAILRYIHANGASMFLLVVYSHMFRGLYYGSYFQPRSNLWYSGVAIFLAMMATAFMGYVLPWGQMSFWGATVITNLFSAIPYIGDSIVQLLWGGFSVDNPTLNRFFSLHYFVPFIIAGLAFLHLMLLHIPGSNNPLGINSVYDKVPFYPYFYVKDLFGFFMFVSLFSFFVIYAPNYLGHPDNYIEANPLVTPAHIVPEWYFLPFYAVLRSIPDKLGGVIFMVLAIIILASLPLVDTSNFRSTFFKPFNIWIFWFFFADSLSLGWIGQEIVESPFIEMGLFVTFFYFFYFLALLPLGGFLENTFIKNELVFNLRQSSIIDIQILKYFWEVYPVLFTPISYFVQYINVFEIAQIFFVILFLLILSFFFIRTGEFARFFNKLSFAYLIFIFVFSSFTLIYNSNTFSFILTSQFNQVFYIYALLIVSLFFFGISDRFFVANSYEIEFALLIFFIHLGALCLLNIQGFIEFLLAIEIVTFASYSLVAFDRKNRFSTDAGVQYFLLGSLPSGMLVLGIALIYLTWGTLVFNDLSLLLTNSLGSFFLLPNLDTVVCQETLFSSINSTETFFFSTEKYTLIQLFPDFEIISASSKPYSFALTSALLLIFFNFFFKITAAPFHFWAPSVYGKAPIAAITFLSIFSKAMIFFAIAKFLLTFLIAYIPDEESLGEKWLQSLLIFVSILTVLFGMLGAFSEKGIKRFFVYSSMGHVGFILIGLALSTGEGLSSTFHYLPLYIITSFIMWFTVLHLGEEKNQLVHFSVLRNSNPMLAFIFSLLIFSMSGIPPLGGFFVKLDILSILFKGSFRSVGWILLCFTVASFFYYLRVVKIIFFDNTFNFKDDIFEDREKYKDRVEKDKDRLNLLSFLFILLVFYVFIVHKPLLDIQYYALFEVFEPKITFSLGI